MLNSKNEKKSFTYKVIIVTSDCFENIKKKYSLNNISVVNNLKKLLLNTLIVRHE